MTIKSADVASNPTDLSTLSRGGGLLARAVFVTPVRVCLPARGPLWGLAASRTGPRFVLRTGAGGGVSGLHLRKGRR